MPSDDNPTLVPPDTSIGVATPEPPYSIFDKRQKWLIIIIVSTAATCTLYQVLFLRSLLMS